MRFSLRQTFLFSTLLLTTTIYALPNSLTTGTPTSPSSTTISTPIVELEQQIQSPACDLGVGGLYICTDINFTGTCTHHTPCLGSGDNTCYTVPVGASSIGPDPGFTCYFYRHGFCRDFNNHGVLTLQHPGVANLMSTELGDWNDKVVSYLCMKSQV
ncbi:hypothetical protein M011DRAFT_328695 [Sporormia fimetaria CBS 119925]|uniref:Uncharacterized protein n=1 Tax=Sporormia fimetaria CBS 119925 TaxID=1340428 RepID=A0A6A6VJA5_9PLEO|nr:hypothetical protein M011DRAFT_328695 [Sporormia fimetaria CBS 119925]